MALITLTNGKTFEAGTQEALLAAALRADLPVEHGCRNGRCGSCRCRLEAGSTQLLMPEAGLSAAERADGWQLACARSAASDLRLDLPLRSGPPLPPVRTLPCRIESLQTLAPDVLGVRLRLPPQQPLAWLPGQHLIAISPASLASPGHSDGSGGIRRAYSIANAPASDGAATPIELQIRRVPGGAFSDWWFHSARPNDLLRLQGPQGSFVLGDVAGVPLLLLATGTGIAPIKALLEQLAALPAAAQPARIDLYWGGRVPADLYWNPLGLAQPVPLRFTPVLSRAVGAWDGARGHVQAVALADIASRAGGRADLGAHQVYACGSAAMVAAARAALQAAGLPPLHFHADAFVCSS